MTSENYNEKKARILVVDDSTSTFILIRRSLEKYGYDVVDNAKCGESAIQIVNTTPLDLILMDINLDGDMDGIETSERIHEILNVPIIFVTGCSYDTTIQSAKQVAPYGYLFKPFEDQVLYSTIEMALNRFSLEKKLKESEERFRTLYENAPVGFYRTTPDGKILLANTALRKMLGYNSFEELSERNLDRGVFEPPYSRREFTEKIEEYGEVKELEAKWNRIDGSTIIIKESAKVIRDSDGKPLHYDGIVEDITERKLIEETQMFLLNSFSNSGSENFFRNLAEYLANCLEMEYVFINKLRENNLVAQTLAVYFEGEFKDNVEYELKDTPCGEVVSRNICCFPKEVRHLYPKDIPLQEMIAESYIGTTLWSCDHKPIGLIAVIGRRPLENCSLAETILKLVAIRAASELERKEAETELEKYLNHLEDMIKVRTEELNTTNLELEIQLEKQNEFKLMLQQSLEKEKELSEMKSQFISTASHEFRTPLTTVLTSSGLLQRYAVKWDEEKKNEHFDRIKNSVSYLTKLLDDVLTVNKVESGNVVFTPEQVDLNAFVQECVDESRNLSENHRLNLQYEASRTRYLLDPKLLKFIFNNLLSNAIKYSPNGGEVEVVISSVQNYLIIEVSDEGIGVKKADAAKIFDPFYRSGDAQNISGTGLGLAIVKRAVDLHKGEIKIKSEHGKGTTFVVKIKIE